MLNCNSSVRSLSALFEDIDVLVLHESLAVWDRIGWHNKSQPLAESLWQDFAGILLNGLNDWFKQNVFIHRSHKFNK